MSDAMGVSKLYWRLVDQEAAPLSLEEAFYLGTVGGGSFFGKVGSFEKGFEFDALVIDESDLGSVRDFTITDRLARAVHLSGEGHIRRKFVQGREIVLD